MAKGVMDPIEGAAQLLANAVPHDIERFVNQLNNLIADKTGLLRKYPEGGINQDIVEREKSYQAGRKAAGSEGFDPYRMAGNIVTTTPLAVVAPVAGGLAGRAAVGGALGATFGALQPVTEQTDDFASEKLKQAGIGAATGAIAPVMLSGLARLISPKASVNPQLQMLQSEGIKPTIGQALGGKMTVAEDKLQSVPLLGDMIHRARGQTLATFNKAAINRALAPIGQQVDDVGHEAIRKAGNTLSQYYDDALSQVKGVKFDAKFDTDLYQLKNMARNLVPAMRNKFDGFAKNIMEHRMSPNRTMLGDVYKSVDSEIGKAASKYGKSSAASEQELGDALTQLQNLLKQQMMRSNPDAAKMIKAADTGWANLVRIERAAQSAKNTEGVFTPTQLNAAIQSMDDSVRHRAVARGTALMQDLGSAGQKILGSHYPDSGTAGRIALGGAAIGAGYINPLIPIGLGVGGSAYTRPVQNALVSMITQRPESAQSVAEMLRRISPYGAAAVAPIGNALVNP
jgi:hypothetical protein